MRHYRRFKKNHRLAHIALMAFALILLWWATWGTLDYLLPHMYKPLGYIAGFLVALFILYLDGFHLKELE
jgi:hypothetical protein